MGAKLGQVIADEADRYIPLGPTRPVGDARFEQRYITQSLATPGYEIHQGVVQYTLPGLGWQRVALAGSLGVIACGTGGRADPWGTQSDHPLSPGTPVLVAVNPRDRVGTLLCTLPDIRSDAEQQFSIPSYVGSWADIVRDPMAKLYLSAADGGGAWAAENNALSDTHQSDHTVRSSTGIYYRISTLDAVMAVDDITGLWINLLDQSVELSGRQLDIASDGVRLQSELGSETTKLQLAGKLEYHGDPEIKLADDPDKVGDTDHGFVYEFEQEPTQRYQYNLYALAQGSVGHHRGDRLITGEDRGVDLSTEYAMLAPGIRCIDHRPGEEENPSQWYPAPADDPEEDRAAREKLSQQCLDWANAMDRLHFSRPLEVFASAASQWVLGEEHYCWLEAEPNMAISSGSSETTISEKDRFRLNESIQTGDVEELDDIFGGDQQEGRSPSSWFIRQADGSVFIGNEFGAGLRLVGSSVFIEGATVRVVASKDICLLGRDLNLQANRDVNCTGENFLRFASRRNIALTSGLSGEGGTLIESRGTKATGNLPSEPQNALYAGVSLRAIDSQVTLYGGDVIAHAGTRGAGQLILRNESGDVLITTSQYAVIHSGVGRLDTFGPKPQSPTGSHAYTQNSVVFSGAILAQDAFFSGGVSAASHIQSFRGVVADSRGGQIGKVIYPDLFNQGVKQLQETNANLRRQTSERIAERFKVLEAPGGPLNKQYREELSQGFCSGEIAVKHYGAKRIQPTYTAMFQERLGGPWEPRREFEMVYKPGTSGQKPTRPWPGDTRAIEVEVPNTPTGFQRRIKSILTEAPGQSPATRRLPYGTIFQTLRDSHE